ncbi:MAG: DEAD/DEAH box helicase [Nanoarchaeota archaeon]|nr:DEAD/DEAH box helicase [Nanoarchaeota archaeon]
MENFKKLGLSENILKAIKEAKFENPSEIQEKAIPLVLQGKDVIGKSATGSGKTLAFGSVIIEKVKKGKGVQALILAPTRELAEQVSQTLKRFARYSDIAIQEVYGGVSMSNQVERIKKSEVIVGTPGRVLDHLQKRSLNLQHLNILVLDEADRMSDMGFLPDVEKIIKMCPQKRQTLLFSATISSDVNYIAEKYMTHPEYISVKSYIEPEKLKQSYYDVSPHSKFSLLVHLLKDDKSELVMVFCNTRRTADLIARNLQKIGLKATAIHGGRTQSKRNSIMEQFHRGEIHILVCTDVAARGLDIKNVSHVYNYDISGSSNDYIHRIGRTARAGSEGEAISLVTNRDYQDFNRIISDRSLPIVAKELPNFEEVKLQLPERSGFRGGQRGFDRGRRSFGSRRDDRRSFGGRDSGGRGNRDTRGSKFGRRDRSEGSSDRRERPQERKFSSRQRSFPRRY